MEKIRKKLKSSSGATALFALAGFLLAAVVSFAIVTAAFNNANRVKGQQEEQRAYLAVTSAASLLRDRLANKTVTITQMLNLDKTTEVDELVIEEGNVETVIPREYTGDDDPLVQSLADAMLDGTLNSADSDLELKIGDDLDMDVKISYDGWRVVMKITPKSGSKYASIAPPMTLTFDNARLVSVESPIYRTVYEIVDVAPGVSITIAKQVHVGYTRVSTLSFPEDDIRVEAKR